MRITKLIKDYIIDEINQKYYEACEKVDREHNITQQAYRDEIKRLEEETIEKAKEIAAKYDLKYPENMYSPIVKVSNSAINAEKYKIMQDKKSKLSKQKDEAIKEILIGLELGDTTKAELAEALNNVTFTV